MRIPCKSHDYAGQGAGNRVFVCLSTQRARGITITATPYLLLRIQRYPVRSIIPSSYRSPLTVSPPTSAQSPLLPLHVPSPEQHVPAWGVAKQNPSAPLQQEEAKAVGCRSVRHCQSSFYISSTSYPMLTLPPSFRPIAKSSNALVRCEYPSATTTSSGPPQAAFSPSSRAFSINSWVSGRRLSSL